MDEVQEPAVKEKPNLAYVDPPWWYNRRSNQKTRFGGGLWRHYTPMKTADLCALPVGEFMDERAVLFLWFTMPHMENACKVIRAWGFRPCTNGFTWVKIDKSGKPRYLPGQYTGSNVECCYIGSRGFPAMMPEQMGVNSVVMEPLGTHSAKPLEVRRRIETLYPSSRKVELFSREDVPGWTCLGDHLSGRDIREELVT